MPSETFLDALRTRRLVVDGAMGTALYERGLLYTQCFDEASVSRAELVQKVHDMYLAVGADIIETNSFGGNRYRLATHGLESRLREINTAAVAVARNAIRSRIAARPDERQQLERVFVAAAVGPTGLMLKTLRSGEDKEIRAAFRDQLDALASAGVDSIIFETFRQPDEIRLALEAARELFGTNAERPALVACVSFDAFGVMADGTGPEALATKLADWGADALGVNCADGPAGVFEMVTHMFGPGLPVVAMPNAGLPHRVEGRFAYMATPEYFQVYARRLFKAGVRAVGGCCGTTADHIKRIVSAARMLGSTASATDPSELASGGAGGGMRDEPSGAHEIDERGARSPAAIVAAPGIRVTPLLEKGHIGASLTNREFIVSVEVNPPPGLDLSSALAGVRRLKEAGIDVINVADGARASARMSNLALCVRIQAEYGMPALMHVTTRDRNLLGLVAHLLGAHEMGVKNLVVITGDPPKMGDFPDATAVYDLDSIGLLRLVRGLNHGFDPGGKALGAATSFLCATGAEPAAHDYEREITRLKAKRDAGADVVMTQPVYDVEVLDRFLKDVEPLGMPVLVGLLPLASYRNAEFLHNEVPGMSIPDSIRERMRGAGAGPAARAEGVAIAREMLTAVKDRVQGAYIMPPFGKFELAIDVVSGIVR